MQCYDEAHVCYIAFTSRFRQLRLVSGTSCIRCGDCCSLDFGPPTVMRLSFPQGTILGTEHHRLRSPFVLEISIPHNRKACFLGAELWSRLPQRILNTTKRQHRQTWPSAHHTLSPTIKAHIPHEQVQLEALFRITSQSSYTSPKLAV